MESLTSQKCVACKADAPKVTDDEMVEFIKEIPDWKPLNEDSILKLRKVFDFDDYFCSLGLGSGRADRYFNDKRTVLAGLKRYCYGLVLYSINSHRWPSIFHALGFAGCICIFYRKSNRRLFLYGWPGGYNPAC